MRRRMFPVLVLILISLVVICGCTPKTFVKTIDPGWNTVEIRDDLKYDDAWKAIVDILARKFDIEILSKEDGYIRTSWLHSWTGELTESYKVRAVVKFTQDRHKVEIRSDAQHYSPGIIGIGKGWEMGTDELLVTTLRTDIMGKVGRLAR